MYCWKHCISVVWEEKYIFYDVNVVSKSNFYFAITGLKEMFFQTIAKSLTWEVYKEQYNSIGRKTFQIHIWMIQKLPVKCQLSILKWKQIFQTKKSQNQVSQLK